MNKLLNTDTLFPLIVDKVPSFKSTWKEFLNEWEEESKEDGYPYYLCMSDFVNHTLTLYQKGEEQTVKIIFEIIEYILFNSDQPTQEIIHVGFLEDLQSFTQYLLRQIQKSLINKISTQMLTCFLIWL